VIDRRQGGREEVSATRRKDPLAHLDMEVSWASQVKVSRLVVLTDQWIFAVLGRWEVRLVGPCALHDLECPRDRCLVADEQQASVLITGTDSPYAGSVATISGPYGIPRRSMRCLLDLSGPGSCSDRGFILRMWAALGTFRPSVSAS